MPFWNSSPWRPFESSHKALLKNIDLLGMRDEVKPLLSDAKNARHYLDILSSASSSPQFGTALALVKRLHAETSKEFKNNAEENRSKAEAVAGFTKSRSNGVNWALKILSIDSSSEDLRYRVFNYLHYRAPEDKPLVELLKEICASPSLDNFEFVYKKEEISFKNPLRIAQKLGLANAVTRQYHLQGRQSEAGQALKSIKCFKDVTDGRRNKFYVNGFLSEERPETVQRMIDGLDRCDDQEKGKILDDLVRLWKHSNNEHAVSFTLEAMNVLTQRRKTVGKFVGRLLKAIRLTPEEFHKNVITGVCSSAKPEKTVKNYLKSIKRLNELRKTVKEKADQFFQRETKALINEGVQKVILRKKSAFKTRYLKKKEEKSVG